MDKIKIPEQYKCPISLEIMNDPIICEDGHTYNKTSVLALKKQQSPITRQKINLDKLIPNIALRQLIEEFVKQNNIQLEKINQFDQQQNQSTKSNIEDNDNNITNYDVLYDLPLFQHDATGMDSVFECMTMITVFASLLIFFDSKFMIYFK